MRIPVLGDIMRDCLWPRRAPKPEPVAAEPAPTPKPERTRYQTPEFDIERIRNKLDAKDNEIAGLLKDFRLAANHEQQNKQPDRAMLARVSLPSNVLRLAIDRNIPRQVFAGVAYFLDLKRTNTNRVIRTTRAGHTKDLTEDFYRLCEAFADRHDISREIANHKKSNADKYRDETSGRVITFIPDRHQEVVDNMAQYCVMNGTNPDVGKPLIEWYALANAGWQDQAINDNFGPFATKGKIDPYNLADKAHHSEPMEKRQGYEMRYPDLAAQLITTHK